MSLTSRADTIEVKKAIIEALLSQWQRMPELRLCQLIVNACGADPFYIEDWTLIEKIEDFIYSVNKSK